MVGLVTRLRQLAVAFALAISLGVSPLPGPAGVLGAGGISIPPRIDHQAKTITFEVKLFIYPGCSRPDCAVTQSMAADIATEIENVWNNHLKFECYTLVFNIQVRRGQQWELAPDEVGIRINTSAASERSEVATTNNSPWDSSDPGDRLEPSHDGSTWGSPPLNPHTYSHEFGHVVGLDDGYTMQGDVAVDRPGAPHDVMSTGVSDFDTTVSQETLDRLVHRAGIKESDLHCDTGWKVHIVWTDAYDGVFDTITFDGIIDTVPPDQPPGEAIYMTGIGTATGSRKGWKLCNPGIDHTPSGTVSATFQGIVTTDTITVSAYADVFTELAGISTATFEADADGDTVEYPRDPAFGEPCPHYSFGTATVTPFTPDPAP